MKIIGKILTVFVLMVIVYGCGSNNNFNGEPEEKLMAIAHSLLGDVNGDGKVTIDDITDLIDYLLIVNGNDKRYDVNDDGKISIEDVTFLIDMLLNGYTQNDGIYEANGVQFKMVFVETCPYMMGAKLTEPGSRVFEKPQHLVILSDYKIGETEVTQELWSAVMGKNPSIFKGDLQRPVEWVSWDDCQEFITKLNEITGKNFRLPTEAEWEFAARGGITSITDYYYFSGSNKCADVAWYVTNSDSITHPVKQLQPNALGIYDMSGNVCEWVNDWYGSYTDEEQINPQGPYTGTFKVYRCGAYTDGALYCRVSYRYMREPSTRRQWLGFRLAL